MIRFATIGTNFITDRFLDAVKYCPELEYTAVYSRTEEKASAFAGKYGVKKWYTDLELLAADNQIDGVYIASPNSLHCEHAVRMMNHGKHVLCEKPVASNEQELKEMINTAGKNKVVFMEAMRSVFDPGFQAVQDNLYKLGTVRRASFQFCQYSSRYDKFKNGMIENAFRPEFSNGALMDIGVYCIHPLVKLFGMPKTIQAQAVFLENGIDGAGTILAGYPHMQAELVYSKITNSVLPSQIQGEEGNMLIREIPDTKEITIYYRDGHKEEIPIEKYDNNMVYEAREWARLIQKGLDARMHSQYSLMEMKVADQVRRRLGMVFPADSQRRWEI